MPMIGGKLESVRIGGREYPVDWDSAEMRLGGEEMHASPDFAELPESLVTLTSSCTRIITGLRLRNNAQLRRDTWRWMRLGRRRLRRKPCAGRIKRTMKRNLFAATREYAGVAITAGNSDSIKAAVVAAAMRSLDELGILDVTPTVVVTPSKPIDLEITVGFHFPPESL